nr:MAG TPA: hypothetical protein [Caudoviricetes sp.]DAZ55539.1 MAG TPA: hypothetical protein [Caudoviricetes sp.]
MNKLRLLFISFIPHLSAPSVKTGRILVTWI